MTISTYFYNALLNLIFGQTAFTIPATYYVALLENDATFVDGDSPVEHVGDSYARVAITNDKTTFSVSTLKTLQNAIDVDFPAATGDWGNQFWVALFDASTAGKL